MATDLSSPPHPTALSTDRAVGIGMPVRDILAALLVMLLWGVNFSMGKLGLRELPPLLLMAVRFGLVALLLCPFFPLPRRSILKVMGLAFTVGLLHFSLLTLAIQDLGAGPTAILVQTQVPMSALLAVFLERDRLGWRRFFGMVVAFIGTLLIIGTPELSGHWIACLLVLVAAAAWAVGSFQIKAIGPISSLTLAGWCAAFATPQLFLMSALTEFDRWGAVRHVGLATALSLFYMAVIVSIGSYLLWYPLVRRHPVNRVIPFTLLIPVFGVLSGVAIHGEAIGFLALLGGILTLAGVALIISYSPARNPANQP